VGVICGIDEAGRGPLAGPVYAAAVILGGDFPRGILADSKALTARQREAAGEVIREKALFGIGQAAHEEIDRLNILQASLLAMRRAFENMLDKSKKNLPPSIRVIVDGLQTPSLPPEYSCEALVKGDTKVHEIMAASILAKTARDAEMRRFDALYPQYGYARHKGYPTKAHREAILKYGPSPIQRLSFRVIS